MAALNANRITNQWGDTAVISLEALPVKANTNIWNNSLVVSDGGYAAPGRTGTGLIAVGIAVKQFDNRTAATGGVAGAITATARTGTWKLDNSGAADTIAQADYGKLCYIVDDQTVAKTDATGTRSVAGVIKGVDADGGVWVQIGVRAVAAA